jgi:TetR/AcrR family transcriptional regulator, cholesterol catabolism regulator
VEVRSLTGDYLAEILARRREYERCWIAIPDDGVRAGLFRTADPQLAMYGMLARGQGVARWYRPDGKDDTGTIADAMADLAVDGVRTTP